MAVVINRDLPPLERLQKVVRYSPQYLSLLEYITNGASPYACPVTEYVELSTGGREYFVRIDGETYAAHEVARVLRAPRSRALADLAQAIKQLETLPMPNLNSIGAEKRAGIHSAMVAFGKLAARYSANASDLSVQELQEHTAAALRLVQALAAAGITAPAPAQ